MDEDDDDEEGTGKFKGEMSGVHFSELLLKKVHPPLHIERKDPKGPRPNQDPFLLSFFAVV